MRTGGGWVLRGGGGRKVRCPWRGVGSRQSAGAFIHPLDLHLGLLTNIAAARRPPAERRAFLFHKTVL